MGNPLKGILYITAILINLSPILSKQVQLLELDANTFMNIATFPPEDDYVVLFYANWDIASNNFQSIYQNVAQTVTHNHKNHYNNQKRKIIFSKFSCGRHPYMCTKYKLRSIPALLFITNVVLDDSAENGIPHSTKYSGNLNLYEQIQDFVEIWHSIGNLIRFYQEYSNKLINLWKKDTKTLNDIIRK